MESDKNDDWEWQIIKTKTEKPKNKVDISTEESIRD